MDGKRQNLGRSKSLSSMTSRRRSYCASTRMKKTAPPPPSSAGAFTTKSSSLSNGDLKRQSKHGQPLTAPPPMSSTPGEDCAFDELLEGRMDLEVVLPDNKRVRMTVDRRTPMMDLLVHAATTNKISPAGHVIKVLSNDDHSVLYKPNTPIGSLDINTVFIVPKQSAELPVKRMPKLANQPFEQTFRLQVNLPRNQRTVLRVSPRITLAELKRQVCSEKELDHGNHHLVHPAQPDTVLDLNSTLDDYGCAEISLMSNSGLRDSIRNSCAHLIAYPRMEEDKRRRGIRRLFSKKRREVSENNNGISSRGISPTRSVTHRDSHQPTTNRDSYQPKQSTKRKPAPAPPAPPPPPPAHPPSPTPLVMQSSSSINSRPESEISAKTDEVGSIVSHSRHSSDSSGYHEPSVFSDCSENKSPEASIVHGGNVLSGHDSTSCKDIPDSLTLAKHIATPVRDSTNLRSVPSCSSTSIVSASRKRKAPQPPAPVLPEVETPSSPEEPPSVSVVMSAPHEAVESTKGSEKREHGDCDDTSNEEQHHSNEGELERDARARESIKTDGPTSSREDDATCQVEQSEQEAEALQYFESVLKDSETSDTIDMSGSCPTDELSDGVNKESQRNLESEEVAEDSKDTVTPDDRVHQQSKVELSHPAAVPSLVPATDPSPPTCISETSGTPSVPLNELASSEEAVLEESGSLEVDECVAQNEKGVGETHSTEQTEKATESSSPVADVQETVTVHPLSPTITVLTTPMHQSSEDCGSPESFCETIQKECSEQEPVDVAETPTTQRRLVNFAMGCYKNDVKDIYNEETQETPSLPASKDADNKLQKTEVELTLPQTRRKREIPAVKIVPFHERDRQESGDAFDGMRGQVRQRCTELSGMSTLPLTGRSASLFSIAPQKKSTDTKQFSPETELKSDGLKRTQSDKNLSQEDPPAVEKSDFIKEQNRLQEEYLKLQAQFISWQKQLLNNQSLLQSEMALPQMPFPDLERYKAEIEGFPTALRKANSSDAVADLKTRSLPRQKPQPLSVKVAARSATPPINQNSQFSEKSNRAKPEEPSVRPKTIGKGAKPHVNGVCATPEVLEEVIEPAVATTDQSKSQTLPRPIGRPSSALETSQTMTLNRQVHPKSQFVSVTIGSWQQRRQDLPDIDSASVASSRSKFQSLENIPLEHSKTSAPVPVQRKRIRASDVPSSNKDDKSTATKTLADEPEKPAKETQVEGSHKHAVKKEALRQQENNTRTAEPKPLKAETAVAAEALSRSSKPTTKPLVRLSSMKDETQPLQIHSLKKWPLPEIKEKEITPKTEKRSIWDEIRVAARWTTGEPREKVTHAEVDLRKHHHKTAKTHASSTEHKNREPEQQNKQPKHKKEPDQRSKQSETAVKELEHKNKPIEQVTKEPEQKKKVLERSKNETEKRNQESESLASKMRITKVNIYSSKDSSSKDSTSSDSVKSKTQKAEPATNKLARRELSPKGSEPFNAELKQALLKRASSVIEASDANDQAQEPTYAEAKEIKSDDKKPEVAAVNGDSPPPPPPPPVSTMPTIPPAAPIPKSSQLLMGKKSLTSKSTKSKSHTLPRKDKDPREELMLEIRGFGGRQALRKLLEKTRIPLLKKSPKKKKTSDEDPCTSSHPQ